MLQNFKSFVALAKVFDGLVKFDRPRSSTKWFKNYYLFFLQFEFHNDDKHLFGWAEHKVDAALVVEIDVPGGVAGLAAPNAGIKVKPLPSVTTRHLQKIQYHSQSFVKYHIWICST
jgi:hypothetical protein